MEQDKSAAFVRLATKRVNNALQAIDSDVTAPYIPANIGPSMDSILQPDF